MPNRIVREGILTSERVAKLDWAAEVFYRRLLSVVDDFGRYYAATKLLRAACYPLQIDSVKDADIEKWAKACEAAQLVLRYCDADGKQYVQVHDFRQQVRAKVSKFPSPDDRAPSTCAADATHPLANAHLDVDVFGDGDGGVEKRRAPANRGTRLPADWKPTADELQWAKRERPEVDVKREAESFADYWHAKPGAGGLKLDWAATWRNWIRRANTPRSGDACGADPSPASMRRLA